ncbi:hypothetical protein ASPZODRAFT_63534 [Penicilliopsis zonata CBS 506.65]|uniref:BTB domain-containing protein n=1 Tax=Penicilliopsis zonata CBS 506.65 TaxID=1073090 RepID=A0A1L9SKN5_9EURO|nr:hypothetical protein ASPZODRAFT_63534 [Penicilliopsis zonata CBS 506.65]OJJ47789.1 hypothetical protein ASPZODRAFT_63534 [Penicilliopsis zonata CBS 506.65]
MLAKRPSVGPTESLSSKYRAGKASSRVRRSLRDSSLVSRRHRKPDNSSEGSPRRSPMVTLSVGPARRLFAAHEEILCVSPFFATSCRGQFLEAHGRRIHLPDEQPEILSCVLEYLYKGDYSPRLLHNERLDTWELEGVTVTADGQTSDATFFHQGVGLTILKDTAVYCAAEKYGLDQLKRLALRKQGLHSGIQCSTILTSARYAYANTPDTDSKLRAHYLALIIRCRHTFKRSGTMQMEMEEGGKLFFDLFVAMCNHMDDLTSSKAHLPC